MPEHQGDDPGCLIGGCLGAFALFIGGGSLITGEPGGIGLLLIYGGAPVLGLLAAQAMGSAFGDNANDAPGCALVLVGGTFLGVTIALFKLGFALMP